MSIGKPVVAVVYDSGAAGPGNILASSRGLCDVLFLVRKPVGILGDLTTALMNNLQVLELGSDLEATAEQLKERNVDAITTFSEPCLEVTAAIAHASGLRFHSETTTRLLTDKVAQRAALQRGGLDETVCVRVQSRDDLPAALSQTGLPAILKPIRGYGSQGVVLIDSLQMADQEFVRLSQFGDLLVEQYLAGNETFQDTPWSDCITVESWVFNGSVSTVCVSGRLPFVPPFREQGIFVPACLPVDLQADAVRLSISAHRALEVENGVTHVEIKFTPSGPRIIEVHGRLGGYVSALARRSLGVDLTRIALEIALGQKPSPMMKAPRSIEFEYFLVPPVEATHVMTLDGSENLASIRGVKSVDLRAQEGSTVDWITGTQSQLGSVLGSARDHADLAEIIDAIESTFTPVFSSEGLRTT